MSTVVAFETTAITAFILLIGSFVMYRCRFIIWKGWFRAIIECEDEDVIIRTLRMKGLSLAGTQDQAIWISVKGVRDRYDIIPDRVRRMGKFRVPTAFYYAHRSEPIDLKELKMQSQISATRNAELARNTVTSQLLNAFTERFSKEQMMILVATGIMVLSVLMLGYFLNSKLTSISNLLGGS